MSHLSDINFENYRNILPISDGVHAAIKDAIFTGLLCPGEHFTENAVAQQFGISRTPAREGLTRLENEAVLTSVSRKGFMVPSICKEDGQQLYHMAILLETYAAAEAARNRSQEDLDKLEALLDNSSGGLEENSKNNYSFHMLIAVASGNKILLDFIRRIRQQLLLLNPFSDISGKYHSNKAYIANTRTYHERILQAIADQDSELAFLLARRHMEKEAETFLGFVESGGITNIKYINPHSKKGSTE